MTDIQFDLFAPKTLARASDPDTSHQGAEFILKHLTSARAYALRHVEANPGCTAKELSGVSGDFDVRQIGRRLGELEKLGLLVRKGPRRCKHSGRNAATWYTPETWNMMKGEIS
jgi:hypothetical protein